MEEQEPLTRTRTRTTTNPNNPFADPSINKCLPSLPSFPRPPPLPAPPPQPGTPPLTPSLQVGNVKPTRASMIRKDSPSVKDLTRVFEKDSSQSSIYSEFNSNNPFRDAERVIPPVPVVMEPEVRPGEGRQRSVSDGTIDVKNRQRIGSNASLDSSGRIASMMSFASIATSAGPGPDLGPSYGYYSQHQDPYYRQRTPQPVEALNRQSYGYGYAPDGSSTEIHRAVENGRQEGITPAGPTEISMHLPFSPTLQRRQGVEHRVPRLDAHDDRSGTSESTKVGSINNDDENPIPAVNSYNTLTSPNDSEQDFRVLSPTNPFHFDDLELSGRSRAHTANTRRGTGDTANGADGRDRIPQTFSQILGDVSNRTGETTGVTTAKQDDAQDSSPAPTLPLRNPLRRPLFKQPLAIPVRPRSVGITLNDNPLPSSTKVSMVERRGVQSAQKATHKLEIERARMGNPDIRTAYLHPSPTVIRLAAEIARTEGLAINSGSVLGNVPLWTLVIIVQCSLLSIAAAVAVILRDQTQSSENVAVGTGSVFWLVISIVIFVISGVATLVVWARKMGYFSNFGKKLGMDEVGLLDRAIKHQEYVKSTSGPVDVESFPANFGGSLPRSTRVQGMLHQISPSDFSMRSIQTQSPEWQYLYPTPTPRARANTAAYRQTPIRLRAQTANDSSSRGDQSPISTFESPFQPAHIKRSANFPFDTPSPARLLSPLPNNFTNNSSPYPIRQVPSRGVQSNIAKPVHAPTWSPLENLQREINDPVIHKAPEHKRHSLIAVKIAESEEQHKNLRMSMERRPSTRLKRVQTYNSSSEDISYQSAIIEDDDERTGQVSMRFPKEFNLQFEVKTEDGGGKLTRSPMINDLAAQSHLQQQSKADSKFDASGVEMDDLSASNRVEGTPTRGNSHAKQGSGGKVRRGLFGSVIEHFTEQHGRSLTSVITDRRGSKEEEK